MKKYLVISIVLSILALAMPTFAARNSTIAYGNLTSTKYYTAVLNITQVNASTITTDREIFFRAAINISVNSTDGNATLTDLNYTLGDKRVVNSVSKIRLLNASLDFIQYANATYADGNYIKAWFNSTNLASNNKVCGAGYILNVTANCNSTFYVEFRLQSFDSNRTVSITKSGLLYTENVTYWGPSDLDPNVTIKYKPSNWESLDVLSGVLWNGVFVTNYTKHASDGILYDPTMTHDVLQYLTVYYTVPETGHGGEGKIRSWTPTTVTPTISTTQIIVWITAIIIICILVVFSVWYVKYYKKY